MSEPYSAKTPLATGTVTMLLTDIEGSTALWEQDGARMSQALALHDALARSTVESHGGDVVNSVRTSHSNRSNAHELTQLRRPR